MSTTASLPHLASFFPGITTDPCDEADRPLVPTSQALTFLDTGSHTDGLIYTCLPPTEGWQPFRYAQWFAEKGIMLPEAAQLVLNSEQGFEVTRNRSYLIAAIPTSRYQVVARSFKNFEILGAYFHLHEMPMESVFWMLRSLAVCNLPDAISWMMAMHEPISMGKAGYRLNYSSVSDGEPLHCRHTSVNACAVTPDGSLTGYGALCFLSE
jgi:hypothetical protein